MKNKDYISFIVAIIIMLIGMISFGIKANKVENELAVTKVDLQIKEDALIESQEKLVCTQKMCTVIKDELIATKNKLDETEGKLQIETEKSINLSEQIDNMTNEIDDLNNSLNIVKSETYNVAYLGEFRYTYYCDERYPHICGGGIGLTASGAKTEVGTTIAVDPSVIPLGSVLYIEGIGVRVAQDTGGAIKGNKIDILLPTHDECFEQTIVNGGVWIISQKNS